MNHHLQPREFGDLFFFGFGVGVEGDREKVRVFDKKSHDISHPLGLSAWEAKSGRKSEVRRKTKFKAERCLSQSILNH